MSNTDTLYTEVTGTTCYVDGQRGTVTGLDTRPGLTRRVLGAFVVLDGADKPMTGDVLYVTLGSATGDRGQHHEVRSSRVIDREEFDRITGIAQLRRDMGWAA